MSCNMNNNFQKIVIGILVLIIPIISQAMSKRDYGQVDVTIKDSQPCFYLADYTREVAAVDDNNKLTYAILYEGSEDLFIVNNVYLDISNSPQSCLPVSEMEALTSEPTISLNKPYGIELKLGIKDELVNGANYISEFCLAKNNGEYVVVKANRGRVTPNSDEVTNYCTNELLVEEKSWFQRLKKWFIGLFK